MPLLDPGGGFASKTATVPHTVVFEMKRLQTSDGFIICNGRYPTDASARSGAMVIICNALTNGRSRWPKPTVLFCCGDL
jgi:hypothetical protein